MMMLFVFECHQLFIFIVLAKHEYFLHVGSRLIEACSYRHTRVINILSIIAIPIDMAKAILLCTGHHFITAVLRCL